MNTATPLGARGRSVIGGGVRSALALFDQASQKRDRLDGAEAVLVAVVI